MLSYVFYLYGDICTKFPWEVIVSTITLTICILTADFPSDNTNFKKSTNPCCLQDHSIIDIVIMTIIRCLAVLYSYYQFRNLQRLGSKYVLGITGLFTVLSSLVFTLTVLCFLQIDYIDLKDAIFFFFLLIDLSKAALLAQFALSSSDEVEIKNNIAKGLSVLGPTITLDTLVETLVIGIGTLSGIPRLELLSYFACLSVVINYIVFMTFYPTCLFLMLESSRKTEIRGKCMALSTQTFSEQNEKTNPVIQRVKIIMTICLTLIHLIFRWSFQNNSHINLATETVVASNYLLIHSYFSKWIRLCVDHVVVLLLLFALIIKFIYFESNDNTLSDINRHEIRLTSEIGIQVDSSDLAVMNYSNTNEIRSLDECLQVYRNESDITQLRDDDIVKLVLHQHISVHKLEEVMKDAKRAVQIRRAVMSQQGKYKNVFDSLPLENFNYDKLLGACCENVVGYMPVPLGIAGPLKLDNFMYDIPMATTEGCLIASTTRGCKAVLRNGITSRIVNDGMTRGPVVRFPTANRAGDAMAWLQNTENFNLLKEKFDSTSHYGRLTKLNTRIAGRYLFIRFIAKTGDAMGMNMLSKGTEESLKYLHHHYPDMEILSLSGNFCTDKKPAFINWIEGRGKSVVCEAIISSDVVTSLLKTSVQAIIDVNISKNLIGSSMAGCVGGYNAHAANVVTAIFIATGQDPAQNVVSSNCITLMEPWGTNGEDLYISCTMPSIEVGTIGGGTVLPAQSACLDMLGIKGGNVECPGENANQLARIVCATVLAGELSLLAALSAGHLVKSHLKFNRPTTLTI